MTAPLKPDDKLLVRKNVNLFMNFFKKIGNKSYYKTSIILTFSIVTIILVIVFSRIGYLFVKELYLSQLSEQVNIVTKMISMQIEPAYLNLLDVGFPDEAASEYFEDLIRKNLDESLHSEIFLFNKDFNVIVHNNPDFIPGENQPALLLNEKEISGLKINSGTASLPFKGDDGNWYLWGFFRLNDNVWLAVRESAFRFNEVDNLSTLFWIIGVIGIIITILIGWFISGSITKPLNKLISFSSEIGKGNFTVSPPAKMHGEIKQLSDTMEKMKKDLSENQQEREKMLAQIAHEIRNPLGGIELLTNLAKENLNGEQKNHEYLDTILKEIHGLKSLITSYLNYSRPQPVNPSWIDMKKLLKEIEEIFKINFLKKNINFFCETELEEIYFDEGHLKQILINLIANSSESLAGYGSILVSVKESPGKWIITVCDDGPGINQKIINQIFNPFFTTKKNGTGLGLSISKKLASENNAELLTESSSNGALFILTKEKRNDF